MSNYFTDYDVITKDEAYGLIPDGKHDECWIRRVEVKQGKSDPSKRFIHLTVDIYDKDGRPSTIIQGLYFKHMFISLCDSLGILDKYENKTVDLDVDVKGKVVGCVVEIQEPKDGYKRKSIISDFFKPEKEIGQDFTKTDVPF